MGCAHSGTTSGRPSTITMTTKISVAFGLNVKLLPTTTVIFVFGGPGSGKGYIISVLCAVFGAKILSFEDIILKYLPKKVATTITLNTIHVQWSHIVEGCPHFHEDIADMVYRDPSHVPLAWVLQLIQDIIESDPNQLYIIDPIPNLHWLLCNDHLIKKDCTQEMNEFEQRVPVSFGLYLEVPMPSLNQALGYSYRDRETSTPSGAIADEADNNRAMRRYQIHQTSSEPFVKYFRQSERLVTVDASSGAIQNIWNKVEDVFTEVGLKIQHPARTILVFAMEGLEVGKLDLTTVPFLELIKLKDLCGEAKTSVETLMAALRQYISTLGTTNSTFIIDPADTSIITLNKKKLNEKTVVFSEEKVNANDPVRKFMNWLNALVGKEKPYFKDVCFSEDANLLFPSSTDDQICQQIALCLAGHDRINR